MGRGITLALVGATGAVGREFLRLLEERPLPLNSLRLFASSRSAGTRLTVRGEGVVVEEVREGCFRGVDIAFISVSSEVSRRVAPQAVREGALVVDDSSAFRLEPQVPLVVPEINAGDLSWHRGIIANPNCTTIQLVMVLAPLHRAFSIRRVIMDTYQAVSGTGRAAMEELREGARAFLAGEEFTPRVYPRPIAFNLFPQVEGFLENGYTKEEWKVVEETRKILHAPDLAISATCVRVPIFVGHSEAVHIEFTRPVAPQEAREVLSRSPGVCVVDRPQEGLYPTPLEAAGRDEVLVGRIRRDASHPSGLALWIVADNLRKGAALNVLQIIQEVVSRDLVSVGERR